jgi:hypothetical protein
LASFAATMTAAMRSEAVGLSESRYCERRSNTLPGVKPLHRSEEPSVRRAEGKRNTRFGTRCHKVCTAADIVAQRDPIEIVKRNAEQGLSILPYIYRGSVLREISAIPRDKESIKVLRIAAIMPTAPPLAKRVRNSRLLQGVSRVSECRPP